MCSAQVGNMIRMNEAVMLAAAWITEKNSERPQQNGRQFADDIFKFILLIENVFILIRISLKFATKGSVNNKSVLVLVMACCLTVDQSLPKPMLSRMIAI